ncbi:MAG: hypothetical protein LUD68_05875, partial [Rikenellaceae bacterium]|nr:hypothetical protein [Rikenellaceae bacterium]
MYNLSPEDLQILTQPETSALVEKHLAENPSELAFRLKGDREQARLVCQQIKYLARARVKIPAFYRSRCLIPPSVRRAMQRPGRCGEKERL